MHPDRLKPDFSKQFMDEPSEWRGKWQNVVYGKSGKKVVGVYLFATPKEAQQHVENVLEGRCLSSYTGKPTNSVGTPDYNITREDFKFAIQLPIKE